MIFQFSSVAQSCPTLCDPINCSTPGLPVQNDLYYILNATLTPDEKDQIWQEAQTHADQFHNQHRTNPVADDAVPLTEPWWTYQAGNAGIRYLHHMITCLLKGMLKNSHIHVNYDKIWEVTQKKRMKTLPFFFHGLLRQSRNTVT